MTHAVLLAKSGEAVKAGPIGLAVILLLCIACYFLFKSMSKHMREVRENFPAADAPTASPTSVSPPAGTGPAGAGEVPRAEVVRIERVEPTGDDQRDA